MDHGACDDAVTRGDLAARLALQDNCRHHWRGRAAAEAATMTRPLVWRASDPVVDVGLDAGVRDGGGARTSGERTGGWGLVSRPSRFSLRGNCPGSCAGSPRGLGCSRSTTARLFATGCRLTIVISGNWNLLRLTHRPSRGRTAWTTHFHERVNVDARSRSHGSLHFLGGASQKEARQTVALFLVKPRWLYTAWPC